MNDESALDAFSALSHPTRLQALRRLVRAHPDGLPAGRLATSLSVPPSTLSTHLSHLERAGLVGSQRDARRIIYSANVEGVERLVSFLLDDCCEGQPGLCRTKETEDGDGTDVREQDL